MDIMGSRSRENTPHYSLVYMCIYVIDIQGNLFVYVVEFSCEDACIQTRAKCGERCITSAKRPSNGARQRVRLGIDEVISLKPGK